MGRKRVWDTDKIKDLYENTDLTIQEIAFKMGMSEGRLSAYLYGTKDSRPLVIVKKRMLPRRPPLTKEQEEADRLYRKKVARLKQNITRTKNALPKMKMSQIKIQRMKQLEEREAELSALLLQFHVRMAA